MNLEDIIASLVRLAGKPVLTKTELLEVRRLMQLAKEVGLSNAEISKVTKGRWSESTVKGYTTGIKTTDPNPWQDALTLLSDLTSTGMSLDDVRMAVAVHQDLSEQGITVKQVMDLLLEADSASASLATIVQFQESVKQDGLVLKDIADILALGKNLEMKGLGLDALEPLMELCRRYGDPEEIIKAVSKYTSLTELDKQTVKADASLQDLKEQIAHATRKLEETEKRLAQLQEPLVAYEKAVGTGFRQTELETLSALAEKYGGSKKVLQAVKAFADYSDILEKISKSKTDFTSVRTKIQQLENEYAHLKTAITMCQTMIDEHSFGLDAIATIFSVAKKYREPLNVLKSLETYGTLQRLQQKLKEKESGYTERRRLLAQLEIRYEETMDKLESLNVTALKVGTEVGKLEARQSNCEYLDRIVTLMNNPKEATYAEYGLIVHVMAASLLQWVITNEARLFSSYTIKEGLKSLINRLEGN